MRQMVTIDDRNYQQFVGDGETLIDPVTGRTFFNRAKVSRAFRSVSSMTAEQAGIQVYPESELADRIRQKDKDHAWLKDLMYNEPCPDQNGYGQCWAFGPCHAFWMRTWLQGGLPRFLSPNPLARDSGYRNWGSGGGDPGDAVETLMKKGGIREAIWPQDSSGHSERWDTPQAKADYENNKVLACVELQGGSAGYAEQVSCVLQDLPCVITYNWWNHVVCGCWAAVVGGEIQYGIRNSWGADWSDNGWGLIGGSRKYCSHGSYAFVEVTQSTQVPQ